MANKDKVAAKIAKDATKIQKAYELAQKLGKNPVVQAADLFFNPTKKLTLPAKGASKLYAMIKKRQKLKDEVTKATAVGLGGLAMTEREKNKNNKENQNKKKY